jgi:hypothetical protein
VRARAFWLAGAVAALLAASACGAGTSSRLTKAVRAHEESRASAAGPPKHVANWSYACAEMQQTCVARDNAGISAQWMATHIDWNEVYYDSADDVTSALLAAAGAKRIVVYTDPNISAYCPVPVGYGAESPDFVEDGANCGGQIARFLHSENESFAHAFQHQASGNRLFDRADGFYDGRAMEPLYIGDPDVRAAFRSATLQNPYATDVLEDDGGGSYNCIVDSHGACSGNYGSAVYDPPGCSYAEGYWCYKYGETAYEWDRDSNPQQAYLADAEALASAAAHPVIGNDGVGTDSYDLQWLGAQNVDGAMSEHAWAQRSDSDGWIQRADAILTYHSRRKYVVEEDTDESRLMFQLASHWIVYDPVYSILFLAEVDPAARTVGVNDMTFPEEAVVPTEPSIATPTSNDVTAFETTPGLFVREYAACYEDGVSIGHCAAIVNTGADPLPIAGLTRRYSHALVHNADATWAAGGSARWSTRVPGSIGPNTGLILAQ